MNDKIIPFGKYKGQPIEVLQQDEKYLTWLRQQDWFKQNYASFNTVIINNFQEPSETPEHNRLVNHFLDDSICEKLALKIKSLYNLSEMFNQEIDNPEYNNGSPAKIFIPNPSIGNKQRVAEIVEKKPINTNVPKKITVRTKKIWELSKAVFEYKSIDVRMVYQSQVDRLEFYIEVKPYIGDDYPAILRQMQNSGAWILIADKFSASGATIDQVREIFKRSNRVVYLFSEII